MRYENALHAMERGRWAKLSEPERLDVLQALEDRAARESGRLARPVTSAWLYTGEDGVMLGCYSATDRTIYVNASQFNPGSRFGDDPETLAETVFHEGRHAFQRDVVEGRVPYGDAEQAQSWAQNLRPGGYVTFGQNPRAYYLQPVEVDAREFAGERLAQLRQERQALSAQAELDRLGATQNSERALDQARRAFQAAAEGRGLEPRETRRPR